MASGKLRLTSTLENGQESSDSTPLADLMLIVLAVQLMVAHVAYTLLPGEISLPKSGVGTRPDGNETKEVVVGFSGNGAILWNGEPVGNVSDLKKLAEKELDHEDPMRFLLAGDREAPYGFSVEVKAALWEAGVREVNELMEPSR